MEQTSIKSRSQDRHVSFKRLLVRIARKKTATITIQKLRKIKKKTSQIEGVLGYLGPYWGEKVAN